MMPLTYISVFRYVDFVSVMTYDFHGKWEDRTGHNSPLYPRADEQGTARYLNMVREVLTSVQQAFKFRCFSQVEDNYFTGNLILQLKVQLTGYKIKNACKLSVPYFLPYNAFMICIIGKSDMHNYI